MKVWESLYLIKELLLSGKCFVEFLHMIAGVRHRTFREIMSFWLEGVMT